MYPKSTSSLRSQRPRSLTAFLFHYMLERMIFVKIAICDGIKQDADVLVQRLHDTKLFINAEYSLFDCGEDILKAVSEGRLFDIVILEVKLPGIDGICVGKHLFNTSPDTVLIFVTNHPEYAINAFDCNAFNYILKSDSLDKFTDVLSKAKEHLLKVNRSYFIKTLGGEVRVLMSEIKYIEYSQKRLTFHTVDGCYTERGQIGELANRFESFGFIYIHQGYIVNAKWVRTIKRNTVLLTDGTEVMMSLKKRKEILEKCHTALKQT